MSDAKRRYGEVRERADVLRRVVRAVFSRSGEGRNAEAALGGAARKEVSMLVRDWMTPNPITVTPDTPVPEAIRLMQEKGFRRLPVVNRDRLVGIVTDRDLKEAMPSKATTLSIWEINYLIAKMPISEVMASPVITVEADRPLEDAALLMEERKIGGLPVLEDGRLVGIITITDVLKAFIEVMGLKEGGLRLTVDVPDRPGALEVLARAIKPSNVVSVATVGRQGEKRRLVLRVNGEGLADLEARLRAAGEEVIEVRATDAVSGV